MNVRVGAIAGAMVGIALLAGVLLLEAARSTRVRRATVERVLQDDATLGADAVATRLQNDLSGRLFVILNAVGSPPVTARAALSVGLPESAAALAARARWIGRLGQGRLRTVAFDPSPPAADLVADVAGAAAGLPEAAYFGVLARGDQFVVFGRPQAGLGAPAVGFPLSALAAEVADAVGRHPVLPPPLTHGADLGAGVSVVVSLAGQTLVVRGDSAAARYRATQFVGTNFGDMTVVVGLADSLAPLLVAGGLPRSRWPLLGALLGLAIVLAVGGLVQLRQHERLARLREDFIASTSHELRTPLAQIRLFAETLRLERVRSEDERIRALSVVEREARRLEHLVENLLHFSRAGRAVLAIGPEFVDIHALTREVVAEFEPLAAKAGVIVTVAGEGATSARVDPGAWRQIVINLLDNAVKYGGPGTAVAVEVRSENGSAVLAVSDQGPGVAEGDRDRVWERFWRADSVRDAGITGAGIGLATVRDLVRLHGGRCRVERAGPRGARFVVELGAER